MDPAHLAARGASAPPDWAGLPRELLHYVYGQLRAAYRMCYTDEEVLQDRWGNSTASHSSYATHN